MEKVNYIKTLNGIWDDIQNRKSQEDTSKAHSDKPQDTLPQIDFGDDWSLVNSRCGKSVEDQEELSYKSKI